MNVSAVMDGQNVTIVDIDVNGHQVYVSYIDTSDNLLVSLKFWQQDDSSVDYYTLASAAEIV